MPNPRYPALFQINTRVRLAELAAGLGRRATLDDLPDEALDRLAAASFDLVGVYDRRGDGLAWQGLSLDLPAWGHHVFTVSPVE